MSSNCNTATQHAKPLRLNRDNALSSFYTNLSMLDKDMSNNDNNNTLTVDNTLSVFHHTLPQTISVAYQQFPGSRERLQKGVLECVDMWGLPKAVGQHSKA